MGHLWAVSRSDAELNVHRAGRQEGKFLSSLQPPELEPAPHEDRLKSRWVLLASDLGEEGILLKLVFLFMSHCFPYL